MPRCVPPVVWLPLKLNRALPQMGLSCLCSWLPLALSLPSLALGAMPPLSFRPPRVPSAPLFPSAHTAPTKPGFLPECLCSAPPGATHGHTPHDRISRIIGGPQIIKYIINRYLIEGF